MVHTDDVDLPIGGHIKLFVTQVIEVGLANQLLLFVILTDPRNKPPVVKV